MESFPPIKLSSLRDIGWTEWDPIGLLPKGYAWADYPEFADEYDRYLLEAASRLRRDWKISDATEYLMWVENDRMGIGQTANCRARAEATAKAITAYLGSLPPT